MIRDEELEINETRRGRVEYFYKAKYHRDEGPAIIFSNGTQHWYRHGKLHREGGPAVIRREKNLIGSTSLVEEIWYKDGIMHRIGGPAVIKYRRAEILIHGRQEYWFEGKLHREEGPAVIDERAGNEWYLRGIKISKKDFKKALNCPLVELPPLIGTPLEPLAAKRLAQGF